MKVIALQSIRTLGMNGAQVVFGLLTSIVLARALGPTERGAYALVILIAGTTAMLCNPGMYASANYFLSTQQWTLGQALGTISLASGIVGTLAGLAAIAVVLFTNSAPGLAENLPVVLALGILTAATVISNSLNGLFFGARKIHAITNWKIVLGLLQCAIFFALSLRASNATMYCVVFAALMACEAGGLFVLFRYQEPMRVATNLVLMRQMLGYGIPVYGSRALLFVGQRLDTYMVFFLVGTASLGHYTIAVTLAEQLWILPLSVSMIMMPNLGRLALAESAQVTATVVRFSTALVLLGSLALALTMPWLLPVLYGAAYTPAVLPFLLLLPGTAAISVYNIVEPFFQSRGQPHLPLVITVVGVLANLAANLILIPRYGMVGAAIASSVAYGLQLAVMCYSFVRLTRTPLRVLLGIDRAYVEMLHYLVQRYSSATALKPIQEKHADV